MKCINQSEPLDHIGKASLLGGGLETHGFHIMWHEFELSPQSDWSYKSPSSALHICLNVVGQGELLGGSRAIRLEPGTGAFCRPGTEESSILRNKGQKHQFVSIDLTWKYLQSYNDHTGFNWENCIREREKCRCELSGNPFALGVEMRRLAINLPNPPVRREGRLLWYQAKLTEVMAVVLFCPKVQARCGDLRQNSINKERVEKVKSLLRENLSEPLSLEQIARRVGCSQYYLSRIFTSETGQTISAYLQHLKLERAAELLQEGRMNVTEVAMDVGYASLSHFSQVFRERYGCCPGLFPSKVQ